MTSAQSSESKLLRGTVAVSQPGSPKATTRPFSSKCIFVAKNCIPTSAAMYMKRKRSTPKYATFLSVSAMTASSMENDFHFLARRKTRRIRNARRAERPPAPALTPVANEGGSAIISMILIATMKKSNCRMRS